MNVLWKYIKHIKLHKYIKYIEKQISHCLDDNYYIVKTKQYLFVIKDYSNTIIFILQCSPVFIKILFGFIYVI